MKIAIFAVLAAICLSAQAVSLDVPSKQPKITCDLFEGPIGSMLCYAHCYGDGFKKGGQCNENKKCVCEGVPSGWEYCSTPETGDNAVETRFTCNVIGGILGKAACHVHCTLHGCDLGVCDNNKQCNCKKYA